MSFTLLDPLPSANPCRRSWRKCAAALVALIVAGCGGSNQPGVVEPVEGFYGGVAADEPRAAIAGRDALIAGGSAVDAAVAVGFTLAVTLPSSAGLGGGGSCIVSDGLKATSTLFDFPATAAGQSRVSVPALVRGFALLHARHGKIGWAQLLGPAETAARFGSPVSRALGRDLADAPADLARDPATARVFAPGGNLIREGDTLIQLDLAAILSQIRQKGGGEFYVGPLGRSLAEASQGALPLGAIRGYLPQAGVPAAIRLSDQQHLLLAGDRPATTALLGRLLAVGVEANPGTAEQPRFWAEAGAAAEGDLAAALSAGRADIVPPRDRIQAMAARARSGTHERPAKTLGPVGTSRAGATSFVVVDKSGQAVVCALGLNAPWGTGRVLPGTGILTAPPPSAEAPRSAGIIVVAPGNGALFFAASASGRAGPAALASVTAGAISDRQDIGGQISRPRVAYDGAADLALVEPGLTVTPLQAAGFKTAETAPLGLVNAFSCPNEMPRGAATCRIATDVRGNGLAFGGGGGSPGSASSGLGGGPGSNRAR